MENGVDAVALDICTCTCTCTCICIIDQTHCSQLRVAIISARLQFAIIHVGINLLFSCAENTDIQSPNIAKSSLANSCHGNESATCLQLCHSSSADVAPVFQLARAHYVTGFTVQLTNATDDVIAHWRTVDSLLIEYKTLPTSDEVNVTAWVSDVIVYMLVCSPRT